MFKTNKWIRIILALSVGVSIAFIAFYFDQEAKNEEEIQNLEHAILMNEMNSFTEGWRNLNQYLEAAVEESNLPEDEAQAEVVWELGKPLESVVRNTTDVALENERSKLILQLNDQYQKMYDLVFEKIPAMNEEQIGNFHESSEESYTNLVRSSEWNVRYPEGRIMMDLSTEDLESVSNEIDLLIIELQEIE
ncbi:hypothetical protein CEY16_06690 [Halalkalibacillus sediminis]|uniref:Uncharacterized protein n=1 Tax=Halalkalibacillus sediminis TaxID=2018042 RepID=A0A2I0QTI9_9BACI|nr:hypothetical protein [Halalkalibacillus sediminis]PKR77618.1 hypothetical protein CEY16_06690 [Halalkalibacillus sediminis]